MKLLDTIRIALFTVWNIVANALTAGNYVWLEGRVQDGLFRNWARNFTYRPEQFMQPATEEEIVQLVRNARKLRVFGSGHSFNTGVVSEETLVSLDLYSGVVSVDRAQKQITVKGGTRVRDVVQALQAEGLAFQALPSHDAQSIAGIISTDVHGTGRDWGFVSQSVVSLKIVNGLGGVIECRPEDPLFQAAIGGVGAVGIIIEVTVQGVDRFRVEQKVQNLALADVERELDQLLQENDHLSLYLFPFTDQCQVNSWNHTDRPETPKGALMEFLSTSADAFLATWVANPLSYLRLLPAASSLFYRGRKGSNLVMESHQAFNRTIYHPHQELEFTVPFEDALSVSRRFMQLYEEMYLVGLPFMALEVRFTPAGHKRTLIGPGQERRNAWIDLVLVDSQGFELYYAAAEGLLMGIGARPHLGKYCDEWHSGDMARLYGDRFVEFQRLVAENDPDGLFANAFTRRLFKKAEA